MARKDGFIRLVQKRMPQGSTPSIPLSDDHTDGTWTYKDLYDGEIAINDTGEFYYRSLDTIYTFNDPGAGATGSTGPAGATGANGYRAIMNLSYTGSSLTLGTGTITLPITTPINNLGWQQGTRLRVWNDATHYMEGQITSVISNPQSSNIDVNIDYVVGSGSFGAWYVGIAGDVGATGVATQTLEDTLTLGNTSGANDIIMDQDQSIIHGSTTDFGLRFTNDPVSTDIKWTYIHGDSNGGFARIGVDNTSTEDWGIARMQAHNSDDSGADIFLTQGDNNITLTTNDGTSQSLLDMTPGLFDLNVTDGLGNYNTIIDIDHFNSQIASKYTAPNPGFPNFEYIGALNTKAGSAMGNETWAELRQTTNNNEYSYIRSTNFGGAYPANILEVGTIGTDWTTIEQNFNEIKITSTNTGFYGVQYDQDWSANYTLRTLVDKEYVDNAVAGGGATPSLSEVLTVGNYSGSNDIEIEDGQKIFSDEVYLSSNLTHNVDFGGALAGGLRLHSVNNTSGDEAYIDLIGALGNVAIAADTAIDLTAGSAVTITGGVGFQGAEYASDYSANFTNRTLVDKEYVDNAITAGGGGGGTVSSILTEVRNQSGATMYRGMVVYISGSTGNLPLVTLSQANGEPTSSRTYGIIKDDISNNGTGYVVAIGSIQNLDTRSTATNPFTSDTLADGDRLYLSPTTAGYVTNIKPSAPNHLVYIGTVVRTSPTNGYIEYQIQNGYELGELHDVAISGTPSNGQVLTYESSTSLWKPTTVSSEKYSLMENTTANVGYRRGTQKLYRLTRPTVSYSTVTGTINGESIYLHSFFCEPGSLLNEIAFRIMTAGASGLGLSECRVLIYKTKLNVDGEVIGGDLELDTNVNISTLTTGIKVVTGLNHTLSSDTYKNQYFIGLRNYQSGSLSVKLYSSTDTLTWYAELNTSSTSMQRDNAWYWTVGYTQSTPAAMPETASTTPSTTVLAPADTSVIYFGISAV